MPDLQFHVERAEASPYAAVPLIVATLRVENRPADELIRSVSLRCQIHIQGGWRGYNEQEKKRMTDLFGEPEQWGRTNQSLLWTHAQVAVPEFRGSTTVEIPISCSLDFNIAATKYFAGIERDHVPLSLQFSGTAFFDPGNGSLQIAQIPWDREARYQLGVDVWKRMMDVYYPNTAWLCLRRDVFDRLHEFKRRLGSPSWEQALETALAAAERNAWQTN